MCSLGHAKHAPCQICDNAYDTKYRCDECKADPVNDGWAVESLPVTSAIDLDEFGAGAHQPPPRGPKRGQLWRGRTKFDSDTARKVAKMIYDGNTQADTAAALGVGVRYVEKVCSHWNAQLRGKFDTPVTLKTLKKHER